MLYRFCCYCFSILLSVYNVCYSIFSNLFILFRKEVRINSTGGKAFAILQITIICRPPGNTDTITLGCRYWKYNMYTLCFHCVLVQTGKSVDWVSQYSRRIWRWKPTNERRRWRIRQSWWRLRSGWPWWQGPWGWIWRTWWWQWWIWSRFWPRWPRRTKRKRRHGVRVSVHVIRCSDACRCFLTFAYMLIVKENEIEARALFHVCSYMLDQLRGVSEFALPLETVESQEFFDMLSGCSDGCVNVVCFQSCVRMCSVNKPKFKCDSPYFLELNWGQVLCCVCLLQGQ